MQEERRLHNLTGKDGFIIGLTQKRIEEKKRSLEEGCMDNAGSKLKKRR